MVSSCFSAAPGNIYGAKFALIVEHRYVGRLGNSQLLLHSIDYLLMVIQLKVPLRKSLEDCLRLLG
jgi:hypothetical protein